MDFCHMFPEIAEGVEFKAAETSWLQESPSGCTGTKWPY
jgi:hypothetical protein